MVNYYLTKGQEHKVEENIASSTDVLGEPEWYMQNKMKLDHQLTIYQNKIKMDKKLKHKP